MEDDQDPDYPLAVHEAGHAVVAHKLGAFVESVQIDVGTGNGECRWRTFDVADQARNLAVCVAACAAERLLDARTHRDVKKDDRATVKEILSGLSIAESFAVLAAGYEQARETLTTHANVVRKVADELVARRTGTIVRIKGSELIELLDG
jgi:hypothetical protein